MLTARISGIGYGLTRGVLLVCVGLVVTNARALGAARPAGLAQSGKASSARKDGSQTASQPNIPNTSSTNSDYIIGPSDVLAVNVWKDPELTRTVLVRPDGKISLPLAGELEVSGLTAVTVQHLVAQKLKDYIDNPQVTVIVQEVRSRTYVIVGKIAHPGSFPLGKPTTVLEAIAIAGGFLDFAKASKVYIIRRVPDGSEKRLPFDYKRVIKGLNAEENITLQDGDTIVVP